MVAIWEDGCEVWFGVVFEWFELWDNECGGNIELRGLRKNDAIDYKGENKT